MGYGGVVQGCLVNVPFNAANFTQNGGAWTVVLAGQIIYRSMRLGKLLFVQLNIQGTVTGNSWLNIALPAGNVAAQTAVVGAAVDSMGDGLFRMFADGYFSTTAGSNLLRFLDVNSGSLSPVAVSGSFWIEVQ